MPVSTEVRAARRGPALIYLPAGHPAQAAVIAAHERAALPAIAWLGGATEDVTSHVRVRQAPIEFVADLPRARHVVHHGGLGVAAWALALGVPQVVLPTDLEKHVIAQALSAGGGGVALSAGATAESIARAIEALSRLAPSPVARIPRERRDALASRRAIAAACEGLT